MSKNSLALFVLFLASCGPTPASPTQLLVTAVTPTVVTPTVIPPTPSSVPTSTTYPSLQTQGPYLFFTRDNKNLTLVDADGTGRRQIQLPNDGYVNWLGRAISPDGRWLAYFTGSTQEPYDVTLHLLDLSNQTTQQISNLLAADFPKNLAPIVESMVLGDPPVYDQDCFEDEECRSSMVQRELTSSIFSLDWSPDGQSIAFTAQIDGPSSDIYIYSVPDKTIRQLTKEPENIYWLDWSPSGDRILYEICSTPGTAYEGRTLHVTDLQGITKAIDDEHLYQLRWGENDWLTENIFLLDHPNDTDKPPIYDLMSVDTDTGELRKIWPYSLEYFAINKENKTIILAHRNHPTQPDSVPEGIYVVYPNGEYSRIFDTDIQFVLYEGQGPYPILAQDYGGRVYSIRSDGSVETLPWSSDKMPRISPDGKLLLYTENNKLLLYNSAYQPIKSWDFQDGIYYVTWNPDSTGVFLFTNTNVYHLAVSADQPQPLMENCPAGDCGTPHFVWLP